MFDVVFGYDDIVGEFVGQGLGVVIIPPFTAIGLAKGASLVSGAVFNQWNHSNVDLTIFGMGAGSRKFTRALHEYAFDQLGANRVTARTKRTNKLVQRLLPRVGFTYECTAPRYYGPDRADDAIVFRFLRDDQIPYMRGN